MALSTFADAGLWLRNYAVTDAPTRLHVHATGDDGAPRFAGDFWTWLIRNDPPDLDAQGNPITRTSWAFQTETATRWEDCRRPHPIRSKGEPRCEMCDDALGWYKTRPVYVRPFMAALERLRNAPATSPQWPGPYSLVIAMLRADCDLDGAAGSIGHPILGPDHRKTVEAAFVNAVRKLEQRWSSGPVPRAGRSESQAIAEAAA